MYNIYIILSKVILINWFYLKLPHKFIWYFKLPLFFLILKYCISLEEESKAVTDESSKLITRSKTERWSIWNLRGGLQELPEALVKWLQNDQNVELISDQSCEHLSFENGVAKVTFILCCPYLFLFTNFFRVYWRFSFVRLQKLTYFLLWSKVIVLEWSPYIEPNLIPTTFQEPWMCRNKHGHRCLIYCCPTFICCLLTLQIQTGEQSYEVNHVVSCLPSFDLSHLLSSQAPNLASLLAKIKFVSVAIINLEYSGKVLSTPVRNP